MGEFCVCERAVLAVCPRVDCQASARGDGGDVARNACPARGVFSAHAFFLDTQCNRVVIKAAKAVCACSSRGEALLSTCEAGRVPAARLPESCAAPIVWKT